MIWLTWRQLRLNAALVYGAVVALGLALLLTGPHLADVYSRDATAFLDWLSVHRADSRLYTVGTAAGYVVPAVIGAFWGAPMIARELEAGTHRLLWTQSVTRTRWLATKLGLGLVASMAAGGLLGLAMTWWAHPLDRAVTGGSGNDGGSLLDVPRIVPDVFAARGIAPIGYAALAFVLGVLAGALVRRTVPAMAITLVLYVALQVLMPAWVRPHLVSPSTANLAITSHTLHGLHGSGPVTGDPGAAHVDSLDVGDTVPGGWKLSNKTVQNGTPVHTFSSWVTECLPLPGTHEVKFGAREQACFDRLAAEGYRQRVTYQPAGHYWALQWRETGLLLAGAALLSAACFWRVRRLS